MATTRMTREQLVDNGDAGIDQKEEDVGIGETAHK